MKYIENPSGGIHSVDDTFELPTDTNGNVIEGWSFVEVEKVPPHVIGTEKDPEVQKVELHDGGDNQIPEQPSVDPLDKPAVQVPAAETPAENESLPTADPNGEIASETPAETPVIGEETVAEAAPEVQA